MIQDLYLNHAGTSWPKPDRVVDAVREAMETSPTLWPQRFQQAHQSIAEYFGVDQADRLLLTPGCTSALAVGIGDVQIVNGQRVLTSCWEHHALHRPLLKLAAEGIQLEYIPSVHGEQVTPHRAPIDLDWLENSLARQDVALVAITAACNVTGELLPYEDVIRIAHQYGTTVLIDAAQVVGWQKLNLPNLGADMVAFGGHKGLQAPWGIGGLYISERIRMNCTKANCELPMAGREDRDQKLRPGYCDVGSVDQVALAGLDAAIQMLQDLDSRSCLAAAHRQIQRIREKLQAIDSIKIFSPADPALAMPTLAFAVSGYSSGEVAARLRQHSLVVGSGLHCAPVAHESLGTQQTGLVRVSVGMGQPDHEIDMAIDRIESVIVDYIR